MRHSSHASTKKRKKRAGGRAAQRTPMHNDDQPQLKPETISDPTELAMIYLFRARKAERVKKPKKFDFTFIADGHVFDAKMFVKDESPKLDLRSQLSRRE
jgi:hypothetical protein